MPELPRPVEAVSNQPHRPSPNLTNNDFITVVNDLRKAIFDL